MEETDSLEEVCEMVGGDYEKAVNREDWVNYKDARGLDEHCIVNGAKIREPSTGPREPNFLEVIKNGTATNIVPGRDEKYRVSDTGSAITIYGKAHEDTNPMIEPKIRIKTDDDSIRQTHEYGPLG